MPEKEIELTVSPPRELNLGCPGISKNELDCGHAFPDLAKFENHFYLAVRSAPSHFPSKSSHIQILRSYDARNWELEDSFTDEMDVRDPQFLQFNGQLFMFYMRHSMQIFDHQPVNILYRQKTDTGWSEPITLPIIHSGFWNIKVHDNKVFMSIYTRNGEKDKRAKRHFALVTSEDMLHWELVFSSPITRERLRNYETSETTFDFDQDGNIFGTIRSLIYPNLNFAIDQEHPDDWRMRIDRFKCDGPKLFSHDGKHYLIARRSDFYKLRTQPFRFFNGWRNLVNTIRYSLSKKRTALYNFDPKKLDISHIQDLPSHGDTGYSAIAPIDERRFLLIYYSSDIQDNKDFNWLQGQLSGKTKLYASTLSFTR